MWKEFERDIADWLTPALGRNYDLDAGSDGVGGVRGAARPETLERPAIVALQVDAVPGACDRLDPRRRELLSS
jgi:hypothetical protein